MYINRRERWLAREKRDSSMVLFIPFWGTISDETGLNQIKYGDDVDIPPYNRRSSLLGMVEDRPCLSAYLDASFTESCHVQHSPAINLTLEESFTISFWLHYRDLENGQNLVIVGKGLDPSPTWAIKLYPKFNESNDRLSLEMVDPTPNSYFAINVNVPNDGKSFNIKTWNHVIFTYNKARYSSDMDSSSVIPLDCYINGVKIFHEQRVELSPPQTITSSDSLNILTTNINDTININLALLRIYRRLLSDGEIVDLYFRENYLAIESSFKSIPAVPTFPASGDISLFMAGNAPSSGDIPLFIRGHSPSSGDFPLYIYGHDTSTGVIPLHIHGHLQVDSKSFNLFLKAHEAISTTASIPLFINSTAVSSGVANSPQNVYDEGGLGIWLFKDNIKVSDNNRAMTDLVVSTSNYLKGDNFGFSVPSTSVINGIKLEVEASKINLATISMNSATLVKGGSHVGTDKGGATVPDSDTYLSFGGESDLWGTTWTPSDINSSGFGTAIQTMSTGVNTTLIDHMRITVYSTNAGSFASIPLYLQCSGDIYNQIPLTLIGPDIGNESGKLNLWIGGHYATTSASIPLFITTNSGVEASIPLYIRGLGITAGAMPFNSFINLYLERNTANAIPLFLGAPGTAVSGEIPLTIFGGVPVNSNIDLYMSGVASLTKSVSLFTRGF